MTISNQNIVIESINIKSNDKKDINNSQIINQDPNIKNDLQEQSLKTDEIDKLQEFYQLSIPCTTFGFDEETKTFFIRVKRGDNINQYPTDQMLKMKKFLLSKT